MKVVSALAAIAAAAGVAILTPLPARASCAGTPPPALAVFTGTVTATDHNGRRATVKTEDGATVTVIGTPDLDAAATSVDRTYTVGARYEFHTLNATSPYQDNACTATQQIGSAPDAPSRAGPAAAIGGAIAVLALGAGVLLYRRRATTRASVSS